MGSDQKSNKIKYLKIVAHAMKIKIRSIGVEPKEAEGT